METRVVRTWRDAHNVFRRCRNKGRGGRVAKETYIRLVETGADGWPVYQLEYWRTPLIRWRRNSDIQVRTGGWDTLTTKRRLALYAGVRSMKEHGISVLSVANDCIVDDGEWHTYRIGDGWLGKDGNPLVGSIETVPKRPASAKRDPRRRLCGGDILKSPEGMQYVALRVPAGLRLVQYICHVAPGLVRVDTTKGEMVNSMFELSLQADGWERGERITGE